MGHRLFANKLYKGETNLKLVESIKFKKTSYQYFVEVILDKLLLLVCTSFKHVKRYKYYYRKKWYV